MYVKKERLYYLEDGYFEVLHLIEGEESVYELFKHIISFTVFDLFLITVPRALRRRGFRTSWMRRARSDRRPAEQAARRSRASFRCGASSQSSGIRCRMRRRAKWTGCADPPW